MLEYVDSWDEDDHLYIQTTLCPMGNLATFLNEYGKNFDRLDEAYIWKILADVADVSGDLPVGSGFLTDVFL